MLLLMVLVILISFFLEHVLNVTFMIEPSFISTGSRSASVAVFLLADSVVSFAGTDTWADGNAYTAFGFV